MIWTVDEALPVLKLAGTRSALLHPRGARVFRLTTRIQLLAWLYSAAMYISNEPQSVIMSASSIIPIRTCTWDRVGAVGGGEVGAVVDGGGRAADDKRAGESEIGGFERVSGGAFAAFSTSAAAHHKDGLSASLSRRKCQRPLAEGTPGLYDASGA